MERVVVWATCGTHHLLIFNIYLSVCLFEIGSRSAAQDELELIFSYLAGLKSIFETFTHEHHFYTYM